ncbi:DNase I-like protein [Mycena rebaudengoi]|nr:DNase I-like protein [Mycena rebaudengoi]
MRDKRIGVLALQETYLSQTNTHNLNSFFERNLAIFSTLDPANPGAKGVAIVLNKQMTNAANVKVDVIVEGQALTVPWHSDLILRFLAVYAPNNPTDNAQFLGTLKEKFEKLPHPDFVLGDFNMVEEALDRLPHHKDTLNKSSGSQSRIDRILVPFESLPHLSEWEIDTCAPPTDHKLILVKYSNTKLPFIGPNNPQTLFKKFKDNVIHIICERSKIMMPAIDKEIKN